MSHPEWLSRLNNIPLFSSLSPTLFRELAEELEVVCVQGGHTVLQEGDPGDALYVLLSGRLRVGVAAHDGEERAGREICH